MGKLKDQLAGVAALVAAIVAIGGGFIKYGEITTKLDALQAASMEVDKVSIEMVTENQKDIEFLKSKKDLDISDLEEGLAITKTQTLVLSKEIELLKIQIEEIKVSTSNPLTN
jgi:tellurite resistance protein